MLSVNLTVLKDSMAFNAKSSILLQTPHRIVTFISESGYSWNDSSVLKVNTSTGKKIYTVDVSKSPKNVVQYIDSVSTPRVLKEGEIHASFVDNDEVSLYGRLAITRLSNIRTYKFSKREHDVSVELCSYLKKYDDAGHVFIVQDGRFVPLT
jgi:hypothetical protein